MKKILFARQYFYPETFHCVSGVQFLRALLFNFREERIGNRFETAENYY